MAMDSAKLQGILEWPTLKTVKEIQSFLGFGNFDRQFTKNFSHLAHPLNNLLKKDKKFIWSNECQESFDLLKKRFTEEPVLMMPDHTRLFQFITIHYWRNSYPDGYKWRSSSLRISVQKSDQITKEL